MSSSDIPEQPYEGQKFKSFDALKKYLEEYEQKNFVKFWIRSSHTRNSLKSKISKTMNPDLKYVCVKFACIFGGEKIRCRGSGIRKRSTYRDLGCPCMINAVVGDDGNHVKLDTVILDHNHALCKTLYDSIKKTKKKSQSLNQNNKEFSQNNSLNDCDTLNVNDISYINYCAPESELKEFEVNQNNQVNSVENQNNLLFKEQYQSTQNCLQNIKDKYGRNIKILVVDSENSDNQFDSLLKFDERENESDYSTYNEDSSEICRLCLSSKEKLSPIFNPNLPLKSTVLSFKIMGCASIEINCNDGLPNNICSTCEHDLDIAYKFRIRCENSDSILRKSHLNKLMQLNSSDIVLKNSKENFIEEPEKNQNIFEETLFTYKEVAEENNSIKIDTKNDSLKQDCMFVHFAISCPVCGSEHDTYESMLEHLETHNDNETLLLACNMCNIICPSLTKLQEHMRDHLNEIKSDSCTCFHCGMIFASSEELKIHEKGHEIVSSTQEKKQTEVNYLCNICGKVLKTKDRFRSHKNTHEGLRPHICLKCGRGFADRKNMHHHYNVVHLRKSKLECPICQKKFYTRTKMKSHVTMHYGVKPFTCDICSKTFRLKMNMIKHKKTHSNDRPYKCDKCNAAFIDRNMLKRHSYVHGGVRPFPCPTCGHRFSVKFHLKKHLEKGKCSSRITSAMPDNYQWVNIAQSETNLTENECVVVYKTDEELLQENTETFTMNILHEYTENPQS